MADTDPTPVSTYRQYSALIRAALPKQIQFDATAEDLYSVQVERGVVFAQSLVNEPGDDSDSPAERLIELTASPRFSAIAVIDRKGHQRPAYRPLLVYAWLQAFAARYETLSRAEFGRWEEGTRAWCDLLEAQAGDIPVQLDGAPASRGASIAESAWMALALHVAGKLFIRDAWTDLASDTFGRLVRGQQPAGPFLAASASDNPETYWYHELLILHAVASYAVQSEDRGAAAAVSRATAFHLAELQPDHATNQPWALFAFIWNPQTLPVADALLHAADIQSGQEPPGLSLILLADALYCLQLFTART